MNTRVIFALVVCVVVPMADAQEARKAGDNPKAVLPTLRRVDALSKADALLEMRPSGSVELVAALADPFYPGSTRPGDKKPVVEEPRVNLTPAQLLARAAEGIQPTGTMLIGTEPYLLLGGRRYKSGDVISVNIEGLGFQVTISSIQRNSYTLRLEDQELRREFK